MEEKTAARRKTNLTPKFDVTKSHLLKSKDFLQDGRWSKLDRKSSLY